jgi:hypothetical protein
MAGIARVRPERVGRLQIKDQTLADQRQGRITKRPLRRNENGLRRSLRLLFVMHLHDRHGAHLTLHGVLKQAG